MRKLIHPETGETITATDEGAKVLLKRGYHDPLAPARAVEAHPKKTAAKKPAEE